MVLDPEQLESLKRQIEEEYRLDMAAIERLQRRFMSSGSSNGSGGRLLASSAAIMPAPSFAAPVAEAQPAASSPAMDLPHERQPDELTGTLRAMFSTVRR
jgi:hypothetical protein